MTLRGATFKPVAMNYRHAYHAGNFADVLKHSVLALVIDHLRLKPTPFRIVDTHAGCGLYDLGGGEAMRTGEWRDGIGRLIGPGAPGIPDRQRALLDPYLRVIEALNTPGSIKRYPGSPAIALALMRPEDRLVANELHPEDSEALKSAIGRDKRAKVMGLDGWQALKALLPPKERRGAVLIDPPFEEAGEFERMAQGLASAVTRFASGIYLLWYPVKNPADVRTFKKRLQEHGYEKLLCLELHVAGPGVIEGLSGTGVVILNPPFRLAAQMNDALPFLVGRLGRGRGAAWGVEWLSAKPG